MVLPPHYVQVSIWLLHPLISYLNHKACLVTTTHGRFQGVGAAPPLKILPQLWPQ